jgi:hypothetical protein
MVLSLAIVLALVAVGLAFLGGRLSQRAPSYGQVSHLPADVESVVRDFRYEHTEKERTIMFEGTRIIRRGKRFFGVRSMLARQNFFEDITGTLKWRNSTVLFKASRAQWALTFRKPLVLEEKVNLVVNGQTIPDITLAILDCHKGIIEVKGATRQVFRLN